MKPASGDSTQISDALGALREELARLSQRVAALEARGTGVSPVRPATGPTPLPREEGLSEEVLVVISAAIAAFLGKKPHIRQIRLIGTTAWAQQGRVTVQASHALSAHHTRSPH
jgi:methylmalonyl-CoA carboxyltransferase large subunit